ncbi:unnamed protein product [Periconia digitata]|uniref:Uncharacterized protein n=1 Tax=Periconia digitata TaxID=1303443 RepID=A0A9W4UGJ5_9PLEO|nr:unnamed protein product [Periconia digitata]
MNYFQLLSLAGLAAANDALLQNPSITSTITTDSDGSLHTIIPMVMTDLATLTSTTTVTTTITEFTDDSLATPTHTIAVQPSGIWWRDGLVGPPIPIPSFASNPEATSSSNLPPPPISSQSPTSSPSGGSPPLPPPVNSENPEQSSNSDGPLPPPPNTGSPPAPPPNTDTPPSPPAPEDTGFPPPPPPGNTVNPPPGNTVNPPPGNTVNPPPGNTKNPPPENTGNSPQPSGNPAGTGPLTGPNPTPGPVLNPTGPQPPVAPEPTEPPDCKDGGPATKCLQKCSFTDKPAPTTSCKDPVCVTALPEVISSCSQTETTSKIFETSSSVFRCSKGTDIPSAGEPVPRPTTCPASSKKKRTVVTPQDYLDQGKDINVFIKEQMDRVRQQGNLVPLAGRGPNNAMGAISSSRQFDLGNQAFDAGVSGLHGCTSVVVIAQRAIWISHLWEIPGFINTFIDPDTGLSIGPAGDFALTSQEFEDRILNFFVDGDMTENFPRIKTAPNDVFGVADEIRKVLIIHPRMDTGSPAGDLRYPEKVEQIAERLRILMPSSNPETVDYIAIDPGNAMHKDKHGTVLVQYDPNQKFIGESNNQALVRVYLQGDQLGEDITWDPLPNQRRKKRDLFARQDADPCADTPPPSTMITVTSPPPSSTPPQTETPSQPTSTLPSVVPNKFKIRIHQNVGGENSVEWTLLDSNGQNTVAGPDTSNNIPKGRDGNTRSEIGIEVMEPGNKDKTRIVFTMKQDIGDGCMPTWDIAPSSGEETSFVQACKNGVASQYGCDDPKTVTWNQIEGGFDRTFECRWLDVSKVTVGLG